MAVWPWYGGLAKGLLYEGSDWTFDTIRRINDAVAEIAERDLKLDTYPNQIEVITAEQMLDAYASTGMPLFYKHWSFGKHFAHHEGVYRKGLMGLAYEIVINSNPCISYIMEENSATMQTLVIAHAAFGHNHFFKNNYLFKQWTDAEGILDYLTFAKRYVLDCEERYGQAAVERLLDAAHALMPQGVHRYPRKKPLDLKGEEDRQRERHSYDEKMFNDLWRTVPGKAPAAAKDKLEAMRRAMLDLPQENLLHFLEKTAPRLKPWQREVLRIVRHVSQYFYPQRQTKVMNEGCATYCHYRIMGRLHETGQIDDGSYLEFLQSHTNVVRQPTFENKHYGGINPYALGFDMMSDIARIVETPTEEDRQWFPEIAGTGDPMAVLRDCALRRSLARQYDVARIDPDIQVVDVDLAGDRRLIVHHRVLDGQLLQADDSRRVLQHLADLWSYDVVMREVDEGNGTVLHEHQVSPRVAAP